MAEPKGHNEFVRYSQWVPSRQHGVSGLVFVDENLDVVTQALDALGVAYEIRTGMGLLRHALVEQRAVFADQRQLRHCGIALQWTREDARATRSRKTLSKLYPTPCVEEEK